MWLMSIILNKHHAKYKINIAWDKGVTKLMVAIASYVAIANHVAVSNWCRPCCLLIALNRNEFQLQEQINTAFQ